MNKVLFVGGTFSVSIYAKVHKIKRYDILSNSRQLFGYHNSTPVYIMDDAADIFGSDFDTIIYSLKDKGFTATFLRYDEEFPAEIDSAPQLQLGGEPNDTTG